MKTLSPSLAACCLTSLMTLMSPAAGHAGLDEALSAMRAKNFETAYTEFLPLAEAGDTKAMTTIGMFYYRGDLKQDYGKAMRWFVRAFEAGDGDAYNNIGVMYRDGLGVPVNREIAYDLFLIVHMRGLGSQRTQRRANGNLRREVEELDTQTIRRALCRTEEEVLDFVRRQVASTAARPAQTNDPRESGVRLRDKKWWLGSEREHMDFACANPETPARPAR